MSISPEILHRIFWASAALYLLVLPIAHTIALRNLAFLVMIGVTGLAAFQLRTLPVLPLFKPWVTYGLVATIASVFALDPTTSFGEFKVEVIYCAVVFAIGAFWGQLQKQFTPVIVFLAVMNAVTTLSALCILGHPPFFQANELPPFAYAGVDGNWLLIAMMLYVWLAIRLWEAKRWGLVSCIVALLALDSWAMGVALNRQNFIALAAGVIGFSAIYLWKHFTIRRVLVCGFTVCVIVALASVQLIKRAGESRAAPQLQAAAVLKSTHTDIRWDLWKFSLEKIAENPIIGGGLGRSVFDKLYPDYRPEIGQLWHAHNMIINKGIQMGIPGMIAFLVLWIALGRELFMHYARGGTGHLLALAGLSGMIAVFVKNQTDDFFVRNVALFFWLVMGLLLGHLRFLQNQHKPEPAS